MYTPLEPFTKDGALFIILLIVCVIFSTAIHKKIGHNFERARPVVLGGWGAALGMLIGNAFIAIIETYMRNSDGDSIKWYAIYPISLLFTYILSTKLKE